MFKNIFCLILDIFNWIIDKLVWSEVLEVNLKVSLTLINRKKLQSLLNLANHIVL